MIFLYEGSNISKARCKFTPVIPVTVVFDIPDLYRQTISAKRFLFIDLFMKRGKDRILMFASDHQLELLFESDTIFMDDTFDTVPANFKQVYLMHVHKYGQDIHIRHYA